MCHFKKLPGDAHPGEQGPRSEYQGFRRSFLKVLSADDLHQHMHTWRESVSRGLARDYLISIQLIQLHTKGHDINNAVFSKLSPSLGSVVGEKAQSPRLLLGETQILKICFSSSWSLGRRNLWLSEIKYFSQNQKQWRRALSIPDDWWGRDERSKGWMRGWEANLRDAITRHLRAALGYFVHCACAESLFTLPVGRDLPTACPSFRNTRGRFQTGKMYIPLETAV